MPIDVACTCGKSYPVKDEFAGLQVQCPDCGAVLTIPVPPGIKPAPRPVPPAPPKQTTPPPPTKPARSVPSRPRRVRRRSILAPLLIAGTILVAVGGVVAALIVLVPKLLHDDKSTEAKVDTDSSGSALSLAQPPVSSGPWKGHTSPIRALGFSVDGRFVLSVGGGYEERNGKRMPLVDNSLRFWESDGGKEHRSPHGFREGITASAFSSDAHFVVLGCAGSEFEVLLYDLQAEKEVRRFPGHTGAIHSVAVSADGRRIVSGGADNTVRVWNVESGKETYCLQGHTKPIFSVAISAKGDLALSAGGDRSIRLWDLTEGVEVQNYAGHRDIVWAAALSPDGKRVASAGGGQYDAEDKIVPGDKDFAVRIWNTVGGENLGEYRGHTEPVGALTFSHDGKRLLSGAADSLRLWQVESGRELTRFGTPASFVRALAFAPDGRRAVSGSDAGALASWELPLGVPELVRDLSGNEIRKRVAAAEALGKLGAEAKPAIPDLLRALADGNDELRKTALTGLQSVGPPEAKDVRLLLPVLRGGDFAEGQRYALETLSKLGPAAEPAVASLVEALNDTNDEVRLKSAELLGTIGSPARDVAWSPLVSMIQDADPTIAAAAVAALTKLGPPGRAAVAKLCSLLQENREATRRYAINALASLGSEASDAVPVLRNAATKDSVADLRAAALLALQKIQPTDKDVIETFVRSLADENNAVGEQAARSLAAVGPKNGALAGLLQALEHRNASVIRIAAEALKTAPLDKSNVAELEKALQNKNVAVRLCAIQALGRLGADSAPAVNPLCDLLKGSSVEERRAVVEALGKMGPAARAAGPRLVEWLKDRDLIVARETAMTLAQIEAAEVEQAIPYLVKTLRITKVDDAGQTAARDRARKLLVRLGKPAAPALGKALRGEFLGGRLNSVVSQANAIARLTVLQTLEEMGNKANVPDVLLALAHMQRDDPVLALRQAAKKVRATVQTMP